ncbi:hypothetical protein KQH40_00945 [bacterium]|nr:hypothetical protein [bacterium]
MKNIYQKYLLRIAILVLFEILKTEPVFAMAASAPMSVGNDIYAIIGQLTQVILALIGGFMGFRILFTVFIAQIDFSSGKPGALADATIEIIFALLLLQIAYVAPEIGKTAGMIAEEGSGPSMGAGDVMDILGRLIFQPLYELAVVLAISATIVIIVLMVFKAQIAALGGAAAQLGQSWLNAATVALLLAFGLIAVRVGLSIISELGHWTGVFAI